MITLVNKLTARGHFSVQQQQWRCCCLADCTFCRVPFSPSLCTADTDPLRLNDSMKSFPSGHAQLAVCSAVFLSLYLARRLAGPVRLVGQYNTVLCS